MMLSRVSWQRLYSGKQRDPQWVLLVLCFIQGKNMKKPWTLAGNMRNKSGNYIRSLDGEIVGRWTALDTSLGYFKDF